MPHLVCCRWAELTQAALVALQWELVLQQGEEQAQLQVQGLQEEEGLLLV